MQKICTLCHYIGKGKLNKKLFGLIIFNVALAALCFSLNSTFYLILGVIFTIFAFGDFLRLFQDGQKCPICNNESLIPLDSNRAQTLIKEHNLTIPEDCQQQSSIPKTSQ